MPSHVIAPGEYLSLIADQAGFRDAMTVWNATENADLRQQRDNPGVMLPGDTLFVPDKQDKKIGKPTGAHHVFRVVTDKLWLRLVLVDFDNQPIANTAVVLEVEGASFALTTDADGKIEHAVPRHARKGVLKVASLELELPLDIGMLDPIEAEAGWKARLATLGYYHGDPDDPDHDNERWGWALEEFQCDHALTITGQADDATRARLLDLFGS